MTHVSAVEIKRVSDVWLLHFLKIFLSTLPLALRQWKTYIIFALQLVFCGLVMFVKFLGIYELKSIITGSKSRERSYRS